MIPAVVLTVLPMYRRSGELAGVAVVDPEDWRWACAFQWSLSAQGYAVRKVGGRRGRVESLHRCLLGLGRGDGQVADHRNGNRLDCRRANLRVTTAQGNAENMRAKDGSSRFRGVTWSKEKQRWRAQACVRGVGRHIGYFDDERVAAEAAASFRAEHMPMAVDR